MSRTMWCSLGVLVVLSSWNLRAQPANPRDDSGRALLNEIQALRLEIKQARVEQARLMILLQRWSIQGAVSRDLSRRVADIDNRLASARQEIQRLDHLQQALEIEARAVGDNEKRAAFEKRAAETKAALAMQRTFEAELASRHSHASAALHSATTRFEELMRAIEAVEGALTERGSTERK